MMRSKLMVTGAALVLGMLVVGTLAADAVFQSGLQPGDQILSSFEPLNVTGEHAGKKHCLVCENGLNPVIMIFARDVNDPLVRLVAKIDAAVGKHRESDLGSFVVFLSDKEDLEKQLRAAAQKHALQNVVLSIDDPAGPEDYQVSKDAGITVVLYHKHVVKANHAFKKGELTDEAIEKIVADLPKILPKK